MSDTHVYPAVTSWNLLLLWKETVVAYLSCELQCCPSHFAQMFYTFTDVQHYTCLWQCTLEISLQSNYSLLPRTVCLYKEKWVKEFKHQQSSLSPDSFKVFFFLHETSTAGRCDNTHDHICNSLTWHGSSWNFHLHFCYVLHWVCCRCVWLQVCLHHPRTVSFP